MDIISWLLVGLIAGALARLLVPGRDPMGWVGTLVLGLIGSLIGGFLGSVFTRDDRGFDPAGLLGSILGAVVALLIYRALVSRGRIGRRTYGP